MGYEKILKLAIVPTAFLCLFSFISVVLTTYYWISGDWFIPRYIKDGTATDPNTGEGRIDDSILYFTDPDTDATIVSGCLCLTAGVMALIAWFKLRNPGMDSDFVASERRFWILSIIVMTVAGSASALASIVLHYTQKSDGPFECTKETLYMAGQLNTNYYCTREMAACNFIPHFAKIENSLLSRVANARATIACNVAVTVKWLQIILILNALVVLAMFSSQAWIRRKTRDSRVKEPIHGPI